MGTRLAFALMTVAAASAQPVAPAAPGRGVNFYSREKEAGLGAQLDKEFRRAHTMIEAPAIEAYLVRLAQSLDSEYAGFTWHFGIISGDTGGDTHEPAALPGGYIFVPAGLFLAVGEEAEFAGMLAHSMAHVIARHGTKTATRADMAKNGTVPLIFMGGWGGDAMRQGAGLAIPLGFIAFARGYELEADHLAVHMLAKAGLDPAGYLRYITRVSPSDSPTPNKFSPVPERARRISVIEEAIRTAPPAAAPAASPEEFTRLQAEVRRLTVRLGSVPTLGSSPRPQAPR